MQIKKLTDGIYLYMLPDEKFKNCLQGIFFSRPLSGETVTENAIIPKILTAGGTAFPDRRSLRRRLEKMFGAELEGSDMRIGEAQTICFTGDTIADCYAGENLADAMWELMENIITGPALSDAPFDATVVKREKEALCEDIDAIINNKRGYALMRCREEMCAGEPFGVRKKREYAEKITPETAFAAYRKMLKEARVDIFVMGAFEAENAEKNAKHLAEMLGAREDAFPKTMRINEVQKVRFFEDREPVQQGKLVMGYRTAVDPDTDAYYALTVWNALFGGGTSSKLFNVVREEMSLCYYASSMLERTKGIMFVQSGIEFDKYAVTLDAIQKQEGELKKGNITEAEFSGAVNGIINAYRSYKDTPASMIGYYLRQLPLGKVVDMDTAIEKIKAVTPEDVRRVAEKIHLDTVYFLRGSEETK